MSDDEIVAVLAHEIGHSKNKDVLKNMLVSILLMLLYVVILQGILSSNAVASAFGFSSTNFALSLIIFFILMSPLETILSIPLNYLSRTAEYKADAFSAKNGYFEAMKSALIVLSRTNFSNLNPHPFVVKLTYSHPPLSQRLDSIEKTRISPVISSLE